MRRLSAVGIVVLVLFTPFTANAGPLIYALGLNGTIYSIPANGTPSPFVTGQGGFCLAADSSGNLYLNNAAWTVSKITPTGSESTYAFADGITPPGVLFHGPNSLAFDATGNLFSNNLADGTITKTGSGGSPISTFVTGLNTPTDVAVDGSGNFYVSSTNDDLIYEITSSGTSTFKSGLTGALAFDKSGNLYVAGNGSISEIAPGGGVSTFITAPDDFGTLAFDGSGNLYAATQFDTILKITPGKVITTFATLPSFATDFVVVPEPSTMVLFGSAAVCLLLWRRRQGRARRCL